jgi:hypothetical protein
VLGCDRGLLRQPAPRIAASIDECVEGVSHLWKEKREPPPGGAKRRTGFSLS